VKDPYGAPSYGGQGGFGGTAPYGGQTQYGPVMEPPKKSRTGLIVGLVISPAIANELKSRSASEEVDSTFLGMGLGDAKDYPAGPLGGVLRSGTGPLGGGTAAACAWADSSTVGAVLTPQSGSVASLAGTTLDLRNAAER
jgi:hypothetical protein